MCRVLDFDVDSDGAAIAPGTVLTDAYAGEGIQIRVVRGDTGTPGLPVAFDSDHPTGGDDDLACDNLGNVLISQECFDQDDIRAGRVEVPDDDAKGAEFDFVFASPMCVSSVTLLDIDADEQAVSIRLLDADGNELVRALEPPKGNNQRQDVTLPATEHCNVRRVEFRLSGSGAVDNLEVCRDPNAPVDAEWSDSLDLSGATDGATGVDTATGDAVFVSATTDNGRESDALLLKYRADGVRLWTKRIGVLGNDVAADVTVDSYGDVIVVGHLEAAAGHLEAWISKFDEDGNPIWDRRFHRGGDALAEAVSSDPQGNIVVTGASDGDIWVQKYGRDGSELLTIIERLPFADIGRGVATDARGDIFVVGEIGNRTDVDGWVRKYSRDGAVLFTDVFKGAVGDDVARGVATDGDGNAVVIGDTVANGFDIWVRKYRGNGVIQWTRDFDGGVLDLGFDVDIDASGDISAVGHTLSDESGTVDLWLRKYDPDGATLRSVLIDNGDTDLGLGVAVDGQHRTIAVGSANNGNDDDIFVAKLAL